MKQFLKTFKQLILTVIGFLLISIYCEAQSTFYYSKVLTGVGVDSPKGAGLRPSKVEANEKGGVFEARVTNTSKTCYDDIQFTWSFPDGISSLTPGQPYRYQITGRRIGGNCVNQKNTHLVIPLSSNSVPGAFLKQNGINRGNNAIKTVTQGSQNVYATQVYKGVQTAATGTITLSKSTSGIDNTYFDLEFMLATWPYGSSAYKSVTYHVLYLFTKSPSTPTATGGANCGALYGMGVNIGIIEYGTLVDVDPTFLSSFFDNALLGAKGSGCLDESDFSTLVSLKKRMLDSGSSKSIANEVSSYRQMIARKLVSCSSK